MKVLQFGLTIGLFGGTAYAEDAIRLEAGSQITLEPSTRVTVMCAEPNEGVPMCVCQYLDNDSNYDYSAFLLYGSQKILLQKFKIGASRGECTEFINGIPECQQ